MPIKSLKRSPTDIPRLKRLGIIHLGLPSPKNAQGRPTRPGKPTEYFELRDAPELHEVYGYDPKPTALNILWPFNDIDHNVDAWHRLYGRTGIKCKGDGEVVDLAITDNGVSLVSRGICRARFKQGEHTFEEGDVVPCGGFDEIYPKCDKCAPVAYLRFMLKEAVDHGVLGYYQITTGSKHGIIQIQDGLEFTMQLARAIGKVTIAGIPMILSLEPQKITVPIKDKRAKVIKHILNIVPHPNWLKEQMRAIQAESLATSPHLVALTQPARALESALPGTQPYSPPITAQEPFHTAPEEPPHGWEDEYEFVEGEFEELEDEVPGEPAEGPNYDLAGLALAFKTQILDDAYDRVDRGRRGKPSAPQLGLLNGLLKDIVGEEQRKLVLAWIFDQPTLDFSTKSLSKAQAEAILDGLDLEKDSTGKYVPTNEKAVEAMKVMLRQARVDSGQIEIEL